MKKIILAILLAVGVPAYAQFNPGELLHAGDLNTALSTPTITGGSINGAPIGQSNPKAVGATSLSVSGPVSGLGFTNLFGAPPILGNLTPAAIYGTNISGLNYQATGPITASNPYGVFYYGTLSYSDTGIASSYAGSLNGYLQSILQNQSNGTQASADYIVSNNLGTATTYYGDFGMNSSTFTGSGSFNLPNATYLYSANGDLVLGTYTANGVHFCINQCTTDAASISSGGLFSIGNLSSSSAALTGGSINGMPIGGSSASSGLFTTLGASGQVTSTVSNGTAPFVVSSQTIVNNLNASLLNGATFASPGTVGGTTPGAGFFTTIQAGSGSTTNAGVVCGYSGTSGYGACWTTAIGTPSASNYSWEANGTTLNLNASTTLNLNIGNTAIGALNASSVTLSQPLTNTGSYLNSYSTLSVNNSATTGYSRVLLNANNASAAGTSEFDFVPGQYARIANSTTDPIQAVINSAIIGQFTTSGLTLSSGKTFTIGGTLENFPASGNIVGTTDTQTLTNKSIAASEVNSGVLAAAQLPVATSSTNGAVQPDNTTITVNGSGVLTVLSTNALLRYYIGGYGLSNDGTTPATVLDIATGSASDSTATSMITLSSAFTKSISGSWVAGSGNNGMGQGLTVSANTWYHVYAITVSSATDIYFDTSNVAANKPAGTTAYRYIGSFLTDGSSHILAFTQFGQKFRWAAAYSDLSGGTATTNTGVTLNHVPPGFVTYPHIIVQVSGTAIGNSNYAQVNGQGNTSECIANPQVASIALYITCDTTSNASQQVFYQNGVSTTSTTLLVSGYINPHVASNF